MTSGLISLVNVKDKQSEPHIDKNGSNNEDEMVLYSSMAASMAIVNKKNMVNS
jgi:hypothetical protein